MAEQTLREINKFNNKIIRTLTKLSQDNPQISEMIQIALYSAIKIQKIISKNFRSLQATMKSQTDRTIAAQNQSRQQLNQEQNDSSYEEAIKMIDGFKSATHKLQRKFNILLNQAYIKKKHKPYTMKDQLRTVQNQKQLQKSHFSKNKYHQKDYRTQSQKNIQIKKVNLGQNSQKRFQAKPLKSKYDDQQKIAEDFDQSDANLSQLDAQILKLTDTLNVALGKPKPSQNQQLDQDSQDQYRVRQ